MDRPDRRFPNKQMILIIGAGLLLLGGWYGGAFSAGGFFPPMFDGMHGSMHAVMHGGGTDISGDEVDEEVFEEWALEEQTEQWLRTTRGFETVVHRATASEITVEVGAGDGLRFTPAAIRIEPGTTVRWNWTGRGGLHDVAFKNADIKARLRGEEGAAFTATFDEPGEYRYECTPHTGVGMRGVVIVSET